MRPAHLLSYDPSQWDRAGGKLVADYSDRAAVHEKPRAPAAREPGLITRRFHPCVAGNFEGLVCRHLELE